MDFDRNIAASFREKLGKLPHRRNHKDLRLKRSLALAVTLRNKAAAQYFGINKKKKKKKNEVDGFICASRTRQGGKIIESQGKTLSLKKLRKKLSRS